MKVNKFMILFLTIINVVTAYDVTTQKTTFPHELTAHQAAHISPEILNELKDFENLIPKAVIDEIVAEHYLLDGNFRTALKYLRSEEFGQLQQQLLNVPEIIDILEFLHLTSTNATTGHVRATKTSPAASRVKALLDEYDDNTVVGYGNRIDKMTANTGTITSKADIIAAHAKESMENKQFPKTPQQQFLFKEDNKQNVKAAADDDDANGTGNKNRNSFANSSNRQHTSVHIVLLENFEVKAKFHNQEHNTRRQRKYHRQHNNLYQSPLGTFTTFVEEVLRHLPHSAYQTMIQDKCKKNDKFAKFYQALRSAEFKPVLEQAKTTANIMKIMQTFGSHDVDLNALEPIAFKVISWGPAI